MQVRTFQGTNKQQIPIGEDEGEIICLNVGGEFLAVGTARGYLRIFDLSRRDAKQQHHTKYIAEGIKDFGCLMSVKVNSAGNKISYTVKKVAGIFLLLI